MLSEQVQSCGKAGFLNQARASHRPVRTWFLKIDFVRIIGMCVSTPEAINNKWRDMKPIQLVKQVLQLLYGNCSQYC